MEFDESGEIALFKDAGRSIGPCWYIRVLIGFLCDQICRSLSLWKSSIPQIEMDLSWGRIIIELNEWIYILKDLLMIILLSLYFCDEPSKKWINSGIRSISDLYGWKIGSSLLWINKSISVGLFPIDRIMSLRSQKPSNIWLRKEIHILADEAFSFTCFFILRIPRKETQTLFWILNFFNVQLMFSDNVHAQFVHPRQHTYLFLNT